MISFCEYSSVIEEQCWFMDTDKQKVANCNFF